MGSTFIILGLGALVLAVGFAFGGWAILFADSRDDEALERDEHNISRGRQPGIDT
jgi:hypothetical protein